MQKLFIVDLEYIESRYTSQWKTHVPDLLRKETQFDVIVVEGTDDIPESTTPGAFLNFGGTTVYKATQIEKLGRLINSGQVRDGDHFLFTDFWHPGVIMLRYMTDLLGIKVVIHGLAHAGSYDPNDFLGRLVGGKKWVEHSEQAMYYAFDHVYFATEYHMELFAHKYKPHWQALEFWIQSQKEKGQMVLTGWPFEFMLDGMFKPKEKENLILFPHRIAPEKQLWTFDALKKELPEYEFIVCQAQNLNKAQYHDLLERAKIVWSANLQETLGISTCIEGPLAGAVPLAPDHVSYREIFKHTRFTYDSKFIESEDSFYKNMPEIIERIRDIMDNYESYMDDLETYNKEILPRYASFNGFVNFIANYKA